MPPSRRTRRAPRRQGEENDDLRGRSPTPAAITRPRRAAAAARSPDLGEIRLGTPAPALSLTSGTLSPMTLEQINHSTALLNLRRLDQDQLRQAELYALEVARAVI